MKNGDQTSSTYAKEIAKKINDNKDISTIKEIYKYTTENLNYGPGEKFGKQVDEIFESKVSTGCTDYRLVFISIAREKGIPAVFVQAARVDWIYDRIRNDDSGIVGHILVEVFIEGKWYLVDKTAGKLFLDYDRNNFSLSDGYYVFAKSLDVWDADIKDEKDNFNKKRELFKNFNLEAYSDPVYKYIDLNNGKEKVSPIFKWDNASDNISVPPISTQISNYTDISGNLIDTGSQRLVYFEAGPTKGYNYPYVIILPSAQFKSENKNYKQYLVVEPNNFGRTSNDLNDHLEDVLTKYDYTFPGSHVAKKLWAPRLMPIFPRPCLQNDKVEIYTHSLDSTTVEVESLINSLKKCNASGDNTPYLKSDIEKLFGLEKQLYNMIEDAKDKLNDAKWNVNSFLV